MGSSHTPTSRFSYDLPEFMEINRKISALEDLSRSLEVLAFRTTDERRTRIHFPTRTVLLKFISNYRSSNPPDDTDMTIVDAICNLITQHVLQWIPTKYMSDICPFHSRDCCVCIALGREKFVLNRLQDLGLDTVKLKHVIDRAYIMSLENNDSPARSRMKRTSLWRSLVKHGKTHQQPMRVMASSQPVYQNVQRPVIVEFIPNMTVSCKPPYRV